MTRLTQPVSRTHAAPVLARLGGLEVSLAESEEDLQAAFNLRYTVFCTEMGARLPGADPLGRTETDRFDKRCDHIIVRDTSAPGYDGTARVVGTYRALRSEIAKGDFYSQNEFDIAPLLARHSDQHFCEVGRSCVAASHRSSRTIEALWCGLWAYAARHGIDVYFGAASFHGADPDQHALPLTFLDRHVGAPAQWQVFAHPGVGVSMDRLEANAVDRRAAIRAMPALIRGYMRVNAHVGQQAFIDPQFGSTDVMIVTRLARMPDVWKRHFVSVTGRDRTSL